MGDHSLSKTTQLNELAGRVDIPNRVEGDPVMSHCLSKTTQTE